MAPSALLAELYADDDSLLLARAVAEFGNREVMPYLRRLGKEEFPELFLPLAAKSGFLGTTIPEEYGGQGGTLEGFLPIAEGIAACDGSLALTLAAHESLATTHILLGGSPELKRTYLPDLTAGRKIGAWCLTEPQAGSNIFKDTRTRLVKTGEGWRLNGEKTFITNGCHADLFVVLAQTSGYDGNGKGITACVVERRGNENRIIATPLHDKMGMCRSDTATLRFDDVPVTDETVLAPVGSGDKVARKVLSRGRIGVGALALGLARDSLERAAAYSKERKVGGGALFDQPLTRAKLFRMEQNLSVAWQAVRSAARCADQSQPFKVQACMAKVFATETALRITDEAIQILGGYGYMRDYKVEQNYRDARLLTIGEGASEILRFAIARNLFATTSGDENVLPSVESLADAAGAYREPLSTFWGPSWRALQLATEALHIVREQVAEESRLDNSASDWQCRAAGFADLATKLWVANQVILTGTKLVNQRSASQKQKNLARTFLISCSIEICYQASEFLQTLGLTDARLLSNYAEALQIGATANSPSGDFQIPRPR
jgi:alkylation response protein AidB-like acyl-CoA dehydrogenase